MSSHDDNRRPPLPDEARAALDAFRAERPSPQQESRLHAALQAAGERQAESSPSSALVPARTWRRQPALWMVMGATLACVLLTVGVELTVMEGGSEMVHEAFPPREVAFRVPEGGGWVILPWSLGRHPDGKATVHLEAPAELQFHQHSAHLPSLQLVRCEGDRCLHRFTASAGEAAEPLRVHIHRPGRYVFNISHASQARRIDESFVVQAEPFQ